jgi:hypothetical protein
MANGDGTFNQTQVGEGYKLDVDDDEAYIMSRDRRIAADSETYQEWKDAEIECMQVKLFHQSWLPLLPFPRLARPVAVSRHTVPRHATSRHATPRHATPRQTTCRHPTTHHPFFS